MHVDVCPMREGGPVAELQGNVSFELFTLSAEFECIILMNISFFCRWQTIGPQRVLIASAPDIGVTDRVPFV